MNQVVRKSTPVRNMDLEVSLEVSPRRDEPRRRGTKSQIQSKDTAKQLKAKKSKSKNSQYQSFGKSNNTFGDYSESKKQRSNSKKSPTKWVVPGVYLRTDLNRPKLKPQENTKQKTFFKKYLNTKKETNRLGELLSIGGTSEMQYLDGVSESQFSRSFARTKK